MPKRDDAPIGAPCWVDLLTTDPERSRDFYGRLFGWTVEDPGEDYGGYVNFLSDGIHVAGCMRNDGTAGVPDLWSVYLATADAEATVARAVEHGGQVMVPAMDVMQLGRMAVVVDVGGAVIGMWQPGLHRGFGIYDEPGYAGMVRAPHARLRRDARVLPRRLRVEDRRSRATRPSSATRRSTAATSSSRA